MRERWQVRAAKVEIKWITHRTNLTTSTESKGGAYKKNVSRRNPQISASEKLQEVYVSSRVGQLTPATSLAVPPSPRPSL